MAVISEIAPNIYRISIFAQWGNLQFNHFLVKDDEPLLFHTGLRGMHAEIREAVSKLISVSELRHISFSHFESDECGSLNEWLAAAPEADVICSQVGALVNVNDFTGRESRALADGGAFATGKYRFRYCRTPHLPHGWDAGVLFEETERTLLCSDLFHQAGDVEPLTSADVVGRSHQALKEYQAGILAEYVPYTPLTAQNLKKLADLKPKTLAIMHGSSFTGDCARALEDLNVALREVFGLSGSSGTAPESSANSKLSASRGPVASVPPLFSCRLQLPVPLGLNLLLMPGEHVLRRDVRITRNRTAKSNVGTSHSKGSASALARRCRSKMRGVWLRVTWSITTTCVSTAAKS